MEKPNYLSLTQYFKGEASQEMSETIESWRGKNAREFEELRSIWEKYGSLANSYRPDLKKAWTLIDERTEKPRTIPIYRMTQAAAVILIMGLVWGFQTNWFSEPAASEHYQAKDELLHFDLTDGTAITLAPGSGLSLKEGFGEEHRQVNLEGKGFFDVSKDDELSFAVKMGEIRVVVHGTQFQVEDKKGTTEVIVTEGNVMVKAAKKEVTLRAKEKAVFDRSTSALTKSNQIDGDPTAWKSGLLTFTNIPIIDMAHVLEEHYRVSIEVDESLHQRRITTNFSQQSLSEVFQIVEATLGVHIDTLSTASFRME